MLGCFKVVLMLVEVYAVARVCCCISQNLRDAAQWLGYTYLFVRMLRAPNLYGVPLGWVHTLCTPFMHKSGGLSTILHRSRLRALSAGTTWM